jgi:hypothetical protein
MKAQIFIASYRNDLEWLRLSLISQKKFCKGFLPPVVNIPIGDVEWMTASLRDAHPEVIITTRHVRKNHGLRSEFMSAQIAMMRADEYCPEAEFIFLLGSESVVSSEMTPEMFFKGERPAMLVSKYSDLEKCHPDSLVWRPGTTRYLGWEPGYEFMRRLPCVYPRKVFAPFREYVGTRSPWHVFDDAIYRWDEIYRDTSEQNLLGAYAYQNFRDKLEWVDVGCASIGHGPLKEWPNPVVTFWSHGGLDKPCDLKFELNGKSIFGRTPRSVLKEILQ